MDYTVAPRTYNVKCNLRGVLSGMLKIWGFCCDRPREVTVASVHPRLEWSMCKPTGSFVGYSVVFPVGPDEILANRPPYAGVPQPHLRSFLRRSKELARFGKRSLAACLFKLSVCRSPKDGVRGTRQGAFYYGDNLALRA